MSIPVVGVPVAGFTVKRELAAWLLRKRNDPGSSFGLFRVHRLPDGGYGSPTVEMDITELLASDG